LQRGGFVVVRVRGSAHFMEHHDGRRTTIHIHGGQTLKRGTLSAILDDVRITADELRSSSKRRKTDIGRQAAPAKLHRPHNGRGALASVELPSGSALGRPSRHS